MEPVYPLEQLVQLKHAFSQRKFAEEASPLVPSSDRVRCRVMDDGLLLEGIGELDLEAAVDVLKGTFKQRVIVGRPAIRYIHDPNLLEPHMRVEVTTPLDFIGVVTGDLSARRGTITAIEDGKGGKAVVRAEVPLSELFGYSTWLRGGTKGTGVFHLSFLEYRRVPSAGPGGPGPGGAAAMRVA